MVLVALGNRHVRPGRDLRGEGLTAGHGLPRLVGVGAAAARRRPAPVEPRQRLVDVVVVQLARGHFGRVPVGREQGSAGPLLSCRSRVSASYSICSASAITSSFWLRPSASRPLQPGSTLSFWVGTADMALEGPARTHGAHRPIS
ncbi:hypothetical protein EYF80_065673 [Liparis tanakae]|uniref:Uncharacterized protein n=1 Tax=Liparis tanakae TaxID=230148 RepID=A0A4Z2E6C8_9TELE|nr:hypothetical protein EYF80_065673 [Liparis tanakae]